MLLAATKVLEERDFMLLSGSDVINDFLNNKVRFKIRSFQGDLVPTVYKWIDENCRARVAVMQNFSESRIIVDLTLYFELAKDSETFINAFSEMKDG